ncbi:MAG: LysM peptidoglycan-binding domain-containing protein [Desulfonatronovibrio sp.]
MERKNWINKLDDLEGDSPSSSGEESAFQEFGRSYENIIIYGLAGLLALILILLVVLFFRTAKEPSFAGIEEVDSRIEALETRVDSLESREEERQKVFLQFTQSEENVQARLDSQREALDDLRQQLAEAGKTDQKPEVTQASASLKKEEAKSEAQSDDGSEDKPEAQSESRDEKVFHKVERGENLFRIGLKYDVSVDKLRELNDLAPDDSIHPGQKLIVGSQD